MFKKPNESTPTTTFRMESDARSSSPSIPSPAKGVSVLGPTLTFKGGELSSDEDLVIEGTVEGKIAHQNHHLTIGKQGRVKADIKARVITVYGTVEGDLQGDEGVHITASAHVIGNVTSPRVSLENGARFEGSIHTRESKETSSVATRVAPAEKPAPSIAKLGPGSAVAR